MNKSGYRYQFVGVCATALLTSIGLMAAPQTGSAKFKSVKGSVTLDSNPAKVGDVAHPGSVVTTGDKSGAFLDLKLNGPDLEISENTRFTIDDLTFDDAGSEPVIVTKIGLKEGKLSGYVKKTSSSSDYRILTPTTTAAIRGTVYTVSAGGKVLVWDGCVDVNWSDPSGSGVKTFNVCKDQMFDPGIPGVVEINPQIKTTEQPAVGGLKAGAQAGAGGAGGAGGGLGGNVGGNVGEGTPTTQITVTSPVK
jgi:FecR protein